MKGILSVLCFFCSMLCMGQNTVRTDSTPPLQEPISGHYAGWIRNGLWTWGGCNFPDVPCADGGRKVFYPMAYGASVDVGKGVFVLGGTDGLTSFSRCFFYRTQEGARQDVPSLPKGLDSFAATWHEGTLWVAGGQTDGIPNREVYALTWPNGEGKWRTVAQLPDTCRLQPCLSVQNTAQGYSLFIFGGYQPRVDSLGLHARVYADGVYMPLAELRKGGREAADWHRTAPALALREGEARGSLQAMVGSTCTPMGYSHVLFFGGVDHDIFLRAIEGRQDSMYLRHEPRWYRFRQEVLTYHTITDSWALLPGDERLARAGACLTPDRRAGGWLFSGGETMPGVRSTDVTHVEVTYRKSFGWVNWAVLGLYLIAMLFMGMYFMRKEKGTGDFFKGGGRIPWWAAGISIYATMISAITYMAIPAKAYTTDWTYYPILWMMLVVSFPVIKYYLPYFRRMNVTSAYEILEQRFNAATRLMASALFCFFMIARMALVLYLPSLALTAVTDIDIYLCIILMGLVTIIYCTMGGVEAVIWGDVVQGLILVGGAIFSVIYLVVNTEGGLGGCLDLALENDKLRLFDWDMAWSKPVWWVCIIGGLANNLISYTSDQTVIQRYMTTPDEKSAGRGILVNGLMSVFVSVAFYMIGTGLYTFYKTHPAELDVTMGQSDALFPFFMMSQMPAGIAGVLIAAIFAATMSTISSNINSVSTAFSIDFYKRFRSHTSDTKLLAVARWTSVVSGLVGLAMALFMATWDIQSLLDYFNTILGLLTSGLGGLFFLAVFLPRVKGGAALTGFITGEAVVMWMSCCTEASIFLFGATGVVVSVVVGWVLSLTGNKK